MIRRASQYLVPFALGAMALGVVVLSGCKPEEPAARPVKKVADPPSVYMKDPAFRKELDTKRGERTALMARREQLIVEAERRVDEMRAKLSAGGREGAAGDAAVKAALEKDPEWISLVQRIEDATAAIGDNRRATARVVADRLAPRPQNPQK